MPAPSVTVTRPNDTSPYGAADVVGGVITLGNAGPADGGELIIVSSELEIDAAAVIASETSYRLHLYSATPPSAFADNTTWDLPSGDRSVYLGFLDMGTPVDLGASLYVAVNNIQKHIQLPTGTLYAYLTTTAAHTPTAQRVYRVKLGLRAV